MESRYLTDLPNIRPNGIECGDFNGDGIEDLVLLDGKKNMLEFLLMDSNQSNWASAMHFEVFEKIFITEARKVAFMNLEKDWFWIWMVIRWMTWCFWFTIVCFLPSSWQPAKMKVLILGDVVGRPEKVFGKSFG